MQSYEYDSYGNRKDMQNTIKQPYTYTGREHDLETGLYNYRARYYDAGIGGFISKDPIGFKSGSVNLYLYSHNNAINFIDPWGLMENWAPLPPNAGEPISTTNIHYGPKPSVGTFNFSYGSGGLVTAAAVGASYDTGVAFAIGDKPNRCRYSTTCGVVGWNALGSARGGVVFSAGTGSICNGEVTVSGGYVEGPTSGGNLMSNGKDFSTSRMLWGLGPSLVGAGYIQCTTTYSDCLY